MTTFNAAMQFSNLKDFNHRYIGINRDFTGLLCTLQRLALNLTTLFVVPSRDNKQAICTLSTNHSYANKPYHSWDGKSINLQITDK